LQPERALPAVAYPAPPKSAGNCTAFRRACGRHQTGWRQYATQIAGKV